jgi:hypothetical protein
MAIFDDTDPALGELLLKLHKGATAGFNAKKTVQVLALFPDWTITPATMIKPTDETRDFQIHAAIDHDAVYHEGTLVRAAETRMSMLHAYSRGQTRLHVQSYNKAEAIALHAEVAKLVVAALPDPKKAKSDDFFVMDLSAPVETSVGDRHAPVWLWSFDLYRKCKGHSITAPDGQRFDVAGPVQVLGFGGTKDFGHFFQWALTNTDLETHVNAKLGLSKHLKASERPRVPVGSQVIGTCAICNNSQVVRKGGMVVHGYQRPGHGYIIGECFGVGYAPYEISADACVAYVPVLEAHKTKFETNLKNLVDGKIKEFRETKHNWRTRQDEIIVVKKGEPRFAEILKMEINSAERQIEYVTSDIKEMNRRIKEWTPGTLRTNEE